MDARVPVAGCAPAARPVSDPARRGPDCDRLTAGLLLHPERGDDLPAEVVALHVDEIGQDIGLVLVEGRDQSGTVGGPLEGDAHLALA